MGIAGAWHLAFGKLSDQPDALGAYDTAGNHSSETDARGKRVSA